MRKNEEDCNIRVLCFETHKQLNYWYREILEILRKAMPTLIWKAKVNERIDFGTQRWEFVVLNSYNDRNKFSGRQNYVLYRPCASLEKDFKNTLINILRGEQI